MTDDRAPEGQYEANDRARRGLPAHPGLPVPDPRAVGEGRPRFTGIRNDPGIRAAQTAQPAGGTVGAGKTRDSAIDVPLDDAGDTTGGPATRVVTFDVPVVPGSSMDNMRRALNMGSVRFASPRLSGAKAAAAAGAAFGRATAALNTALSAAGLVPPPQPPRPWWRRFTSRFSLRFDRRDWTVGVTVGDETTFLSPAPMVTVRYCRLHDDCARAAWDEH